MPCSPLIIFSAPGWPDRNTATLMAARLHRDGNLEIINCGHVPAIVASSGSVSQIEDGDLPVGLIAAAHFHAVSTKAPAPVRGWRSLLTA